MRRCQLDHLVIAAAALDEGRAYVERQLGVSVPVGGKHPLMGTHNRLMRLGEGCFLEIIAMDPDAPAPQRPRWFSLDDPKVRAELARKPRLHTWVTRMDDIETAVKASPVSPGLIEEGRRGDMTWQITIPEDGVMPEGGMFPAFIQWPGRMNQHGPAPGMADLGCRLKGLRIAHRDPAHLRAALEAIGAGALAEVEEATHDAPPGLTALIETPAGVVSLS